MTDKRPLVYVVDDEDDALELFSDVLTVNFDVKTFNSPVEALQTIAKQPPQCLLTDLIMPEMNGVEFVRKIRRSNQDLPILVLSGYGDRDQVVDIFRMGCFDFLSKPIKYQELTDKVRSIIATQKSESALLSVQRANKVVSIREEAGRLELKFARDSLASQDSLTLVRLQLTKVVSAYGRELSFDFSEVEDMSIDALIFIKSYLRNLDLDHKKYHMENLSEELKILLSAELTSYQAC